MSSANITFLIRSFSFFLLLSITNAQVLESNLRFTPMEPCRFMDTRSNLSQPGSAPNGGSYYNPVFVAPFVGTLGANESRS